jgi:hypothetical protein
LAFAFIDTHRTETKQINAFLSIHFTASPDLLPSNPTITDQPQINMATERTVSIFVPANGRKNYMAHNVPVNKLVKYSWIAKWHYFPTQAAEKPYDKGEKRSISSMGYDLGANMDEEFARIVATHIKKSDLACPTPLTLELFDQDLTVEELVQIWRVIGRGYNCPLDRRDDAIREDLRHKMYQITPFTFSDFRLIVDDLYFDRGMFRSAMDRAAYLHVKGHQDDEDKVAIEAYCRKRQGWWDILLDMVGRVLEKAAAEKEIRDKKKEQQKTNKERRSRESAARQSSMDGNRGKKASAKEKAKKPVAPFRAQ